MSDPVLDPVALQRLRRIGGERLLGAMIDLFLEHGPARMHAARAAAEDGDGALLSEEAHALKSSAGNLGATTLQLSAQRVEREALQQGADLRALLAELEAAFAHATAAIEAERPALDDADSGD